jgi:hypothetical protein
VTVPALFLPPPTTAAPETATPRAAWVEQFCHKSGRRHPPISGLDLPDDYTGHEWVATPAWNRSACETGVKTLAAMDLENMNARCRAAFEKLDRAYTRLHHTRVRAIAHAQRQVRGGILPKKPPSLFAAIECEEIAFTRLVRLTEIYNPTLPEVCGGSR